nr:acyl-CoA dehydrogenase family protein [uncultured Brevundimonas sp.]
MDFEFTQEQTLVGESVDRLLTEHYGFEERRQAMSGPDGFSREIWGHLADLGVLGLPFDEADGGFSGSGVDLFPVMSALGKALALEPYLATVVLAGGVLKHASSSQKAERLPRLMQGDLVMSLAHHEPDGLRHTIERLNTTARKDAEGWVLNGRKTAVLAGASAEEWIVSARTDAGVTLFLVPRDAPGAEVRRMRGYDGQPMADLILTDVRLPDNARLGSENGGGVILTRVFEDANAALCAEAVGIMDDVFEATVAYLKTRKQFGVPIGSFQALQHRAVDMMMEIELARSMALMAALALDMEPDARASNIAAAKARVAHAGRVVGEEAVQLHGAIGLTDELKVGHGFKRLIAIGALFGDADHHLSIVTSNGLPPLSA